MVEGVEHSGKVEQALDWNDDSSYVTVVVEGPFAVESKHEAEAVGEEGGIMESEVEEGVVPSGACPTLVVDGGGVPSVGVDEGVGGDGDDGVDLHLQDEPDIF